ncbi:MAG: hypothetical protein AMXMBFR81_30200 [Chthonomonas sp.]
MSLAANGTNRFYAKAANQAASLAQGEAFLFLNPDARLYPGWRERFESLTLDPPTRRPVGAVGPVSDGSMGRQFVGLQLPPGPRPPDADRAAESVARFNADTYESVKLLVGFCLFVPRGVWESVPAAYGSLGPPRAPHVHQPENQPKLTEHQPNNTEQNRTLPNQTEQAPFGFHPDLELGCDDLEYSWRLRRSGFELLLARDVFVSHACRVSFSRADYETAKKVAEADAAMHGILNEEYGETVDRVGLFGFDPLG